MQKKLDDVVVHGDLIYNHKLAHYTSWRVGGNAERFYRPVDLMDLQNFIAQLPPNEPLTWLGLGSNVLIRDGGIKGTVILTLNRLKEVSFFKDDKRSMIRAESGVTCSKLSKFCASQGLEEGAFFAGIPGTIGGALAMNAGAFGGETWRHVICVETIDHAGVLHKRQPNEFKINYREVHGLNDQFFVAGYFNFDQKGEDVTRAKKAISRLLKKRSNLQPTRAFSCGSVFRNPPDDYAARLIESAGLKGTRIGNAEISEKHANFVLNIGEANAFDIELLIKLVVQRVYDIHGIQLKKEVHILGDRETV